MNLNSIGPSFNYKSRRFFFFSLIYLHVHVSSSSNRFSNLEFVVKEVTRLIHSEPVNFINIPEAAEVMSYTHSECLCLCMYIFVFKVLDQ